MLQVIGVEIGDQFPDYARQWSPQILDGARVPENIDSMPKFELFGLETTAW
jgi:hypothetical protein